MVAVAPGQLAALLLDRPRWEGPLDVAAAFGGRTPEGAAPLHGAAVGGRSACLAALLAACRATPTLRRACLVHNAVERHALREAADALLERVGAERDAALASLALAPGGASEDDAATDGADAARLAASGLRLGVSTHCLAELAVAAALANHPDYFLRQPPSCPRRAPRFYINHN